MTYEGTAIVNYFSCSLNSIYILRNIMSSSDIKHKAAIAEKLFRQHDVEGKGELSALQLQTLHETIRMGGISLAQVKASMEYCCLLGDCCELSELFDVLQEMDRRYFLLQDLRWEFALLDREQRDVISEAEARFLFEVVHGSLFSLRRWEKFIKSRPVPGTGVSFAEIEVDLCNIPSREAIALEKLEEQREREERERMYKERKIAEELRRREFEEEKKRLEEEKKQKEKEENERKTEEEERLKQEKEEEQRKLEEEEKGKLEAQEREEKECREKEMAEKEAERLRELEIIEVQQALEAQRELERKAIALKEEERKEEEKSKNAEEEAATKIPGDRDAMTKISGGRDAMTKIPGDRDTMTKIPGDRDTMTKIPGDRDAIYTKIPGDRDAMTKIPGDRDAMTKIPGDRDAMTKIPGDRDAMTKIPGDRDAIYTKIPGDRDVIDHLKRELILQAQEAEAEQRKIEERAVALAEDVKAEAENSANAENEAERAAALEKEAEEEALKAKEALKQAKNAEERRAAEEAEKAAKERAKRERNERIRKELKVAIKKKDRELIKKCVKEFKAAKLADTEGDLKKAETILKRFTARDDLVKAMEIRTLESLEKAIDVVKKNGFEPYMPQEMAAANKMLLSLKRLKRLRDEILNLKQSTVAEIRSYSKPPPQVHKVMTATYLLLGNKESELKDWKKMQALIGKTGKDGLKRRVMEKDPNQIKLETAKKVKSILSEFDLEQVRDVSAGAAVFFAWSSATEEDVIEREKQRAEGITPSEIKGGHKTIKTEITSGSLTITI